MPLTVGHCIDGDTDAPCVNRDSTLQNFLPIEGDTVVHPIIGFQGSPMFVLSVQGQDIAIGIDQDAPQVDVRVFDGEQDVGGFSSRPVVEESSEAPGLVTAHRLYVVSFFADELLGKSLDVKAEVEDRNGNLWCGEGSFTVGDVIDSEPIVP